MSDTWKFFYRAYNYIPASVMAGLIKGKDENRAKQLSLTVVAISDRTLDVILKIPVVCLIK